jgi:crotonobetaine/carnitine-CoA ligase
MSSDLKREFPLSDRTVPRMLTRQAQVHGARTLFCAGTTVWSFEDARAAAAGYAEMLASAGVQRGDRVALICGNRAEFLGLFLGCGWLGAVSVPINTASRGFQLYHILSNSGAIILVIEAACLPALEGIDLANTAVQRVWVIGEAAGWDPLPAPGPPVPSAAGLGPGDLLTILYTSGTTGMSKGVCCPHAQFFAWAYYVGLQLGLVDGDVLHTTLPLFHVNALGCVFQALLHGGSLVVEPRFSVSRFWERLIASEATVTYLLGAMVPMLLSQPVSAAETAHRVRIALAPGVPAGLQTVFSARSDMALIDGYGATESNAVIGCDSATRRDGFMGRLLEDFEGRVVDENDAEVPDGEAGELVLRAAEPFAFAAGYFGMPDKTVEAWRNLWLHTGDRVVRSPDGYFRFVDRMKDAIRRRGENISSYEVEQVLLSHPAVETVAVYAVPSELAEDEVMASVVIKSGGSLAAAELIAFCDGKMSSFAVPRYVAFIDELPRTESGKIKKFILREQGISAGCWDRLA